MTSRIHLTRYFCVLCAAAVSSTILFGSFAGTARAWPPGGNGGGPGGGGGGGSTPAPAGTIYFRHAATIWQMDGAGTPESRIPLATVRDYGDPSYARHGNQRWFAYDCGDERAPEYPPFPNGRYFRDIRAGSESGQEILLWSQPDIEIISWANWTPDDGSITFIGERWQLDPDGLPAATDAGIYELPVDFSSGTPVAGALEFVAELSGPMRAGPGGFLPQSDGELAGHTWNHDGTQLAFGIRVHNEAEDATEIWIADLPSGTPSLLASGRGLGWPQWSPDGSRIGYVSVNGTIMHELSSDRTKVLKRTPTTSWEQTFWSPSGAYFAIGHWDNFLIGEDAIYRFTASIGGKTELIANRNSPVPQSHVLIPLGWRN